MGDRASYRPIESPLSPTSDAVDVVRGLLGGPSVSDALCRRSRRDPAQRRQFPRAAPHPRRVSSTCTCGSTTARRTTPRSTRSSARISARRSSAANSQRDSALIAQHRDSRRIVLSLDFRGDAFQGPEEILAEPDLWPRRIIVMTLARVGSGAGPDLARLGRDPVDRGRARNLCRRRRARRRRSRGAQGRGRRRRADRDRPARAADRRGRSGGDLKSAVAKIRSSCRRDRTA